MVFAAILPICLALEMSLPVVVLCSQTMVFVVQSSAGGEGLPMCIPVEEAAGHIPAIWLLATS